MVQHFVFCCLQIAWDEVCERWLFGSALRYVHDCFVKVLVRTLTVCDYVDGVAQALVVLRRVLSVAACEYFVVCREFDRCGVKGGVVGGLLPLQVIFHRINQLLIHIQILFKFIKFVTDAF